MYFWNNIRRFLAIAFTVGLATNSFASLHTYHTSLTLMDYNSDEKLVEITIQLVTHDLVNVLESKTRNKVDLEKKGDSDAVLLEYLNENFVLSKNGETVGKLVWVGIETRVDRVQIYVEIPYDGNFENLELKNTIFFESFAEQTNLTTFNFGESKSDLVFKQKDIVKDLKFHKKDKD